MFRAFLIDMNQLFERFISEVLKEQPPVGITVGDQDKNYLDDAKRVKLIPDIVVRRSGQVVLVADCKNKPLEENEFRNHDLYQLLAYSLVLNAHRALLIHLRYGLDIQDSNRIRNTNVEIRQTSIDLGVPYPGLIGECDELTAKVFGWSMLAVGTDTIRA